MLDPRAAEVFIAVAEELHFGRAAVRLNLTQPAVSRQVRKLEAALGATLLTRTHRRVELTPAGRAFLVAARDAVAAAQRAVDVVDRAARGVVGSLRVGSSGSLANELAGAIVADFRSRYAAVNVVLSQYDATRPLAGIDRQQADVVLVRAPVTDGALTTLPLVEEPRIAVLSRRHPLARRASVSFGELLGEPVVTLSTWPQPVRDLWAGADRRAGKRYRIEVRARNKDEWLRALANGRGVSLCPASTARFYPRADLAFVPVDGLLPSRLVLAWDAGDEDPLVRNFVSTACSFVAQQVGSGWRAVGDKQSA